MAIALPRVSEHRSEPRTQGTLTISVSRPDDGGWDVLVEQDGWVLAIEHCTDWHRVERRRALWKANLARPPARLLPRWSS